MKNRQRLLMLAVAFLLLAGGGLFLYRTGFFQAATSLEGVRAYIDHFSPYSYLCFFLVQILSVIFAPIPSNVIAAAGGLLFGTLPAFLITFCAVVSGSLFTFSLARILGQKFVDRFVSQKLSKKYQSVLQTKAPIFLILAFLFPFFPDDMLCILAGLTSISVRRFALIVLFTRPWGLLFASALGGSTFQLSPWVMVALGLLGLVLFLLGMKYGDKIEQAILSCLKAYKSGKTK